MDNSAFGVEKVQTLEDHLNQDSEYLGGDDTIDESVTEEPQRLPQWFEYKAMVSSRWAIDCQAILKLPDKARAWMPGVGLRDVSHHVDFSRGSILAGVMSTRVDLDSNVAFLLPWPPAQISG